MLILFYCWTCGSCLGPHNHKWVRIGSITQVCKIPKVCFAFSIADLAAKKPGKNHILKFYNALTIMVISSKWLQKFKDSAIIYSRRHKRMYPMTASLCFVSPWNQMLEYQALKDGWLLYHVVSCFCSKAIVSSKGVLWNHMWPTWLIVLS